MITDVAIRALKRSKRPFQESFGGGLFLEVLPGGGKSWRLRHRFLGKQEKATLGDYPSFLRKDAARWREDCIALYKRGISPAALKRGALDLIESTPEAREMAREFVRRWCPKEFEAAKARIAKRNAGTTVEVFAWRWFAEVVQKNVRKPKNIKRALEKDIIPRIGSMQLRDITPTDIFSIVDPIKNRGAEQMALQTRGMLKRMFDYAVVRELATTNPAGAIKAKFIATASSRSTVLTPTEIGAAFRKIYQSNMKRANKLALHLIMITLVRKSMLLEARWGDVNFTDSEWEIPAERMKLNHAHVVPLSQQALEILGELKLLSNGSEWIMPSVRNSKKHVSNGILNSAVKGLVFNTQAFVIHDFRRTASTLLNEQGYNKDWIEKALSHETLGIRGVYNKAEYLVPRRKLMRSWAAFVDTQIADDRRVVIGGFKQSQNVA